MLARCAVLPTLTWLLVACTELTVTDWTADEHSFRREIFIHLPRGKFPPRNNLNYAFRAAFWPASTGMSEIWDNVKWVVPHTAKLLRSKPLYDLFSQA